MKKAALTFLAIYSCISAKEKIESAQKYEAFLIEHGFEIIADKYQIILTKK